MRTSRSVSIVAAVMAAVLGAGCGADEPGASGSGDKNVTLTWFMWSSSDVDRNAWLRLADMVTQQHPNIKIKFETTPFNDYWT
ncbi:MAG TPA: hypothetical protein VFO77_05835, partial [Actinoplanes sp.]|nr:hypothetical protein [Actinoplanes sp.]